MTVYMHGKVHVAYLRVHVFDNDRFEFQDEIRFKEGRM